MIEIDVILLVGAVVLIAAIIAARIGARVGLPSLLLFLGLGMVMGESGIGISFDNAELAQALGFAALVVILAEGGLTTRWSDIRSSTVLAALLATVGVGISVGLMTPLRALRPRIAAVDCGAAGRGDLPDRRCGGLLGAAQLFPSRTRLRGALEAESGPERCADGAARDAGELVGRRRADGVRHCRAVIGLIVLELVGGMAIGGGLGWLGAQILRRVALPSSGLYPLAILVWTMFAYGIAALIHASGFAAVYVCALILGNAQLPHRAATRSFVEGIGWIAQIGLFVMLGLLAFPDRVTPRAALIALAAGLFLTLVARPASVVACAAWFKIPCGIRSSSPGRVCAEPCRSCWPRFRWPEVAGAEFLFDVVLVFVIVFTCLQGPTLPFVARRLGLVDDADAQDVEVEVAPLDKISADLLQVRIPAEVAARRCRGGRAPAAQGHRGVVDHSRRPALLSRCPGADQGWRRAAHRDT